MTSLKERLAKDRFNRRMDKVLNIANASLIGLLIVMALWAMNQ